MGRYRTPAAVLLSARADLRTAAQRYAKESAKYWRKKSADDSALLTAECALELASINYAEALDEQTS